MRNIDSSVQQMWDHTGGASGGPAQVIHAMTTSDIEPPEELSPEVIATLDESSDQQLREIIHYAQLLLSEHPPLTDAIEEREGEELVRIDDQGAYSIVVVERPGETGEARGPFAYRVQWEPSLGDEEGKYYWHYLGRVHSQSGGG